VAYTLVRARTHVHTLGTERVAVVLVSLARINLKLTGAASPAIATGALERVDHVSTCAAIHARRRATLVRVDLAVEPAVPIRTHTAVGERVIEASATVEARCRGALVELTVACANRDV